MAYPIDERCSEVRGQRGGGRGRAYRHQLAQPPDQ